jgi:hypothetical protein
MIARASTCKNLQLIFRASTFAFAHICPLFSSPQFWVEPQLPTSGCIFYSTGILNGLHLLALICVVANALIWSRPPLVKLPHSLSITFTRCEWNRLRFNSKLSVSTSHIQPHQSSMHLLAYDVDWPSLIRWYSAAIDVLPSRTCCTFLRGGSIRFSPWLTCLGDDCLSDNLFWQRPTLHMPNANMSDFNIPRLEDVLFDAANKSLHKAVCTYHDNFLPLVCFGTHL